MAMTPLSEVFKRLAGPFTEWELCGSKVTCNPAPDNTDTDYLLYVDASLDDTLPDVVAQVLHEAGFSCESFNGNYEGCENVFGSWRRKDDNVNFIVSTDEQFVKRHRAATALCKRLNLMHKPDRIALFQAVLYGEIHKA